MDTQLEKGGKSCVKGYLISKHIKQNSICYTEAVGVDLFTSL